MEKANDQILQDRLRQTEIALERSERMAVANRYAGAIMHEVNNPLEAITNLVYLTKIQKDSPRQVLDNMLVIEEQLKTLGRVTSQALTFHREHTEAKEFDLVDIAESALRLHADKLARHQITVDRQFRRPARASVFGSEILQVLSNLILNAAYALPPGEGRISVRVRSSGQRVHILISDNGEGIPKEFSSRLFEPYITSKISGTGLGLWLSHRIISKHAGTLRFEPREEKGGQVPPFAFRCHRRKQQSISSGETDGDATASSDHLSPGSRSPYLAVQKHKKSPPGKWRASEVDECRHHNFFFRS
jgi:signal transduction histidine kinase